MLTLNFSLPEFYCHDAAHTPVPDQYMRNVVDLAAELQVLRDRINRPIHIVSGYRTPAWNKQVGGVPGSQHLLAKAADLQADGMTPAQLHAVIEELIAGGKMKQGGLGLYRTFVHYDIRGTKARWSGA
jgi:uncharacterized protein YcbK (DUF882 family)